MNNRLEQLEKQFKKRYNRNVEICLGIRKKEVTQLIIKSPKGKEYIITEYRKNGLTDKAIVKYDNKEHKYNHYIAAELHIADEIGEEEDGNS